MYPREDGSRCQTHVKAARKQRVTNQVYSTQGHRKFRAAVLEADPICVICNSTEANVADHYPRSREDLIKLGFNPNNPANGRGLCKRCHDQATASNQPGGWNQRS